MRHVTLGGRAIVEGRCEGQALVSTKAISFLGGVDPTNGKIVSARDGNTRNRDDHDKLSENSLLRTHIKQDRDGLCTIKTMPRNSLRRIRFIRMKIYFA